MASKKENSMLTAGAKAPDFQLQDLSGQRLSRSVISDGKPALLAFFKVSCPVCQFTFPFLERMYKKFGGEGVSFLAISQDDARATKEFARQYGMTFPIALDEKGYPASNAYGLSMVPTI